jgi:hypothetical protein
MIAVTEQAKELLRDTKYPEGTAIRESKQHQDTRSSRQSPIISWIFSQTRSLRDLLGTSKRQI